MKLLVNSVLTELVRQSGSDSKRHVSCSTLDRKGIFLRHDLCHPASNRDSGRYGCVLVETLRFQKTVTDLRRKTK